MDRREGAGMISVLGIIQAFSLDVHGIEERAAIMEIEGGHNPKTSFRAVLVDTLVTWILVRPEPVAFPAEAMLMLEAFLESREGRFPVRGDYLTAKGSACGRERGLKTIPTPGCRATVKGD
jgi:hypothetical protein